MAGGGAWESIAVRVVKCQTKIGAAQRAMISAMYLILDIWIYCPTSLTSFNCIYDVAFPREIKGIRHILHKKQSIQLHFNKKKATLFIIGSSHKRRDTSMSLFLRQ